MLYFVLCLIYLFYTSYLILAQDMQDMAIETKPGRLPEENRPGLVANSIALDKLASLKYSF
jgi:hypothetical protein